MTTISFPLLVFLITFVGVGCQPDVAGQGPVLSRQLPTATVAPEEEPVRGEPSDDDSDDSDEVPPDEAAQYTPSEPLDTPLPVLSEVASGCTRFEIPFVMFTIREDGTTEGHRYLQGTGCDSADEILMSYVQRWTFRPATVDGQPVVEEYTTAIHW